MTECGSLCVAVCVSVLQYASVCCRDSHMDEPTWPVVSCSLLRCALQRGAVCCSVLQGVAVCLAVCVAVCCSVLQRVAACCSVLQRVYICIYVYIYIYI